MDPGPSDRIIGYNSVIFGIHSQSVKEGGVHKTSHQHSALANVVHAGTYFQEECASGTLASSLESLLSAANYHIRLVSLVYDQNEAGERLYNTQR
jgi:hypothetical protein